MIGLCSLHSLSSLQYASLLLGSVSVDKKYIHDFAIKKYLVERAAKSAVGFGGSLFPTLSVGSGGSRSPKAMLFGEVNTVKTIAQIIKSLFVFISCS